MQRFKTITSNSLFFINILLVFLLIFASYFHPSKWLAVVGRLHPAMLHFPIALLVLVFILEILYRWKPTEFEQIRSYSDTYLLPITALFASITALMGFFLATEKGDQGSTLDWHKWLGVGTALGLSLLIWLKNTSYLPKISQYKHLSSIGLGALTVLLTLASHQGATLTHGENFVTEPLLPKVPKQAAFQGLSYQNVKAFDHVILPILENKCGSCHNPNKAKGGLILTSADGIRKGGEDGKVFVAGNPDGSELVRRLMLPKEDEDRMPPKDKPAPTEEEVALLKWWIQSGASFDQKVAALHPPQSVKQAVERRFRRKTESPVFALDVPFASPEALRTASSEKRVIRQISMDRPFIDVFMGGFKNLQSKDLSPLSDFKDQIVSLNLTDAEVKDEHLDEIANLTHLVELRLTNTKVTDAGVEKLKELPYLETLSLEHTQVTANSIATLQQFPRLRQVSLGETQVKPAQLIALQQQKKLRFRALFNDANVLVAGADTMRLQVVTPEMRYENNMFKDSMKVSVRQGFFQSDVMVSISPLNGSQTTFRPYQGAFYIKDEANIRLFAKRDGWKTSDTLSTDFFRAGTTPQLVTAAVEPDKYFAKGLGVKALFDAKIGSERFGDGKWIGMEGKDLALDVDMGKPTPMRLIVFHCHENMGSYIFLPKKLTVMGGDTPQNMHPLATLDIPTPTKMRDPKNHFFRLNINNESVRYLKIIAQNTGHNPSWHPAAGAKSWVFLSEIIIR